MWLPADGKLLHPEVHADRRRCTVSVEDVVDVAEKQRRLAAVGRADQEELDGRLFIWGCHGFFVEGEGGGGGWWR